MDGGYNYYGQLGINNNADQTTPVKMQKYQTSFKFQQETVI